jgi:CRISPR-associated protein Csb2
VEGVLEALASADPSFELPPATASHTRSYLSSNSWDPTAKNLVFDAFLALEPARECLICWPELNLSDEQRAVLSVLLENLNYLGRSESWVRADLTDRIPIEELRCDPVSVAAYSGDAAAVACVVPPNEYKGRKKWADALTTSTTDVVKARVSVPPLLKQVRYVRREGAIEMDPVSRAHRRDPDIEAMLLGLDSTVLPLATSTIEVAEQIRVRLMGAHRKVMGDDEAKVSSLFSGKKPDGSKRDDHGHLYILPISNSGGRIERVLLLSRRQPFRLDEISAVCRITELYQSDGRPAVRCVLTWQGKIAESDVLRAETVVQSTTPFVTVRHWRRGRDFEQFLVDEIHRECRNHGMPEPLSVEHDDGRIGLFHSLEYRRNRKQDPPRPGYSFRLRFAEPVLTPFSLGYGSHFGLGQFRKAD